MSFGVNYIANQKIGVEDVGGNANGVDIQGIDEVELEARGERLPVIIKDRKIINEELLTKTDVRNTDIIRESISTSMLTDCKDFDFIIENTLDKDITIGFRAGTNEVIHIIERSNNDEEVLTRPYNVGSSSLHHVIPSGSTHVKLSSIRPYSIGRSGSVSAEKSPFKNLYLRKGLSIEARAVEAPTSGSLRIYFIGIPN